MTKPRQGFLAGSTIAGLLFFAAPVAWLALQQGVGTVSYLNCGGAGLPWGGVAGAVATAACAAAAVRCWNLRGQGSETRRFLMIVGSGAAGIFGMAALVMTVAIVLVPACAR